MMKILEQRRHGMDARPVQPAGAGSNPADRSMLTELQRDAVRRILAESGFESADQVRRIVARLA